MLQVLPHALVVPLSLIVISCDSLVQHGQMHSQPVSMTRSNTEQPQSQPCLQIDAAAELNDADVQRSTNKRSRGGGSSADQHTAMLPPRREAALAAGALEGALLQLKAGLPHGYMQVRSKQRPRQSPS
jgi:hypothetical protein